MTLHDKLVEATTKLLEMIELRPIYKLTTQQPGQYQVLSPLPITLPDQWPQQVQVPMSNWEQYLEIVGVLTQERVNQRFIGECINQLVCEQIGEWPIPDNQRMEFSAQIVVQIEAKMDFRSTAYVPLVGVKLQPPLQKVPLARATLRRSYDGSEFADHIRDKESLDVPLDIPYLVLDVAGDDESIALQIQIELENALKALRYVSWTASSIQGCRRATYNQAVRVTQFPLVFRPYIFISRDGYPLKQHFGSSDVFRVSEDTVKWFKVLGLDELNFHFAQPSNPISEHILLALDWFDSGVQAYRDRDALYRFVVCLDCVLSWRDKKKNDKELMRRLRKLLAHFMTIEDEEITHDFFGEFDFQPLDGIDVSDKKTSEIIEMLTNRYAEVFKYLYSNQRGKILHGLPENPSQPLTKEDIKDARLLAHNAIRLLMKLVQQNPDWTTEQDVEAWFNQLQSNPK